VDGETQPVDTEDETSSAQFDLRTMAPWTCPPTVHDCLFDSLKDQWQIAKRKQSIPDIVAFATAVEAIGNQHGIAILSRYGNELAGYAGAFDIQRMERLLGEYDKILDLCTAPTR
jgi:hypothetical protein